jgi:hypothetical protein
MVRMLAQMRGSLRLARGRCPSCFSEASEHCDVCLDYRGPFPVDPDMLWRWHWRYESSLAAAKQRPRESVTHATLHRHA